LWTSREYWDAAPVYDPYANLIITLAGTGPNQDDDSTSPPAVVTALRPASGREAWSLLTGNQVPQLAMVTKGLVLVATSGPAGSNISPSGGPPAVWVINDQSGAEIRDINLASDANVLGLTRGVIVASTDDALYGYSPHTGSNLWRWFPAHGCTIGYSVASAMILSVLTHCANGDVDLTSVNPATSVDLWSRKIGYYDSQQVAGQIGGDADPYVLSVQGRFIAIAAMGSASIFSASGDPVDSEQQLAPDAQPFVTFRGDKLFVAYSSAAGNLVVKEVNSRTRASRVLIRQPLSPISMTIYGGALYILTEPSWPLLAASVVAIDTLSGSHSVAFLPYVSDSYNFSPYASDNSLVSAAGDLLLSPGEPVLNSYSPSIPGNDLAARSGRWPSACSLLGANAAGKIVGDAYVSVPQEGSGGSGVPRASACEYAPSDRKFPIITVGVAWTADTVGSARTLMRNIALVSGVRKIAGVGSQAYRCNINGCQPGAGIQVLLRVRKIIVDIRFSSPSPAWRSITSEIAGRLGRSAGS
jgi:hypothetical protein